MHVKLMSTSQKLSQMKEQKLVVNINGIELDLCEFHRLLGVNTSVCNGFDWNEQVRSVCNTICIYSRT